MTLKCLRSRNNVSCGRFTALIIILRFGALRSQLFNSRPSAAQSDAMAASKGSALSVGDQVGATYEVVDRVGAGGMGVVYKARDLKLERFVALKFLPPGLNASKLDKERFLKEARIASSLDHPNTGVIYGIEETDDGHTFIVMAYYEGQSLAHRIQDGPPPAARSGGNSNADCSAAWPKPTPATSSIATSSPRT